MSEGSLSYEEPPEHVCIEHFVELLLGDFFEWHPFIYPRVIDQDVDLSKSFLSFDEESLDYRLFCNVSLNRDRFAAALGNFGHHAICVMFCRRIVDYHRRARIRECLGNSCTNPFRCSSYQSNFSV